MVFMDVHTSVLAILIVGWLGGSIAQALRLPRIVPMILLGIALYPNVHPAVINRPAYLAVSGVASPGLLSPDSQAPASSIRTMALLIALARGGLSLKASILKELAIPSVLLATLPYACELIVEALVAPSLLPAYYGSEAPNGKPSNLIAFASASVWAPLSPSIVIPNMLSFVDMGLTKAGHLVLTGAPLEVSTALVTEGVMSGCITAMNSGQNPVTTLGHIPTYVFGSALYGIAFSLAYAFYLRVRGHMRVLTLFGKADPTESKLVFLVIFLLCYTTSIDDINTPWLIGFFAALCMAVATQHFNPATADELVVTLRPVWYFAECFLFVLTGCVIRPAIDSGLSLDLFGWLFAVLLIGQCARMSADVIVAIVWQSTLTKTLPHTWDRSAWADVTRRVAFVWTATIPKATLQATLGPKLTTTFGNAGPTAAAAAKFVAPAAAISILYMATLGSLLTFTLGKSIAIYFQDKDGGQTVLARSDSAASGSGLDEGPSTSVGEEGSVVIIQDFPASPVAQQTTHRHSVKLDMQSIPSTPNSAEA